METTQNNSEQELLGMVAGLLTAGNTLLADYPSGAKDEPRSSLQKSLGALTDARDEGNVARMVSYAEACVNAMEEAEISMEERRLSQEEQTEEGTIGNYLDMVMEHPDDIPLETPTYLDAFGLGFLAVGGSIRKFGVSLYRTLFFAENLFMMVVVGWAGCIALGLVTGVMSWYFLFWGGVGLVGLFVLNKMLGVFFAE